MHLLRGGAQNPFASPLSAVVEHMAEIINEEFKHEQCNGYEIEHLLLLDIAFKPKNPRVSDDIASFLNKHKWSSKDTFADRLECAWQRFCEVVTHLRRYTFSSSMQDRFPEQHPLYMPPSEVLPGVKSVITDLGLVRELPKGTEFWRARVAEKGKALKPPDDFTSPPDDKAEQNRMSPAGISMFYGADDFGTALLEITPKDASIGWRASAVRFMAIRPLQVLDLTIDLAQMAHQKSYFAPDGRKWRHYIRFLERFAHDVSQRFVYDDEFLQGWAGEPQPDIDYVPTQVFTEYVRYHLRSADGQQVDGISYRSSQNTAGRCIVLFLDQGDCLESRWGSKPSLRWIPGSRMEAVINQTEWKWHYEGPS